MSELAAVEKVVLELYELQKRHGAVFHAPSVRKVIEFSNSEWREQIRKGAKHE